MAKYTEEIKKIEQIITTAKELNKAFAGDPETSYKNGLSAMEFVISICEPLITDLRGRPAANEQSGKLQVFDLEQERAKLKAEGKVI